MLTVEPGKSKRLYLSHLGEDDAGFATPDVVITNTGDVEFSVSTVVVHGITYRILGEKPEAPTDNR